MYINGINYGMNNNLMDEAVVEISFSDGISVSSTRLEDGEIIYVANTSIFDELINADEELDVDYIESYDFDIFDPEDMTESKYYKLICITRNAMKEIFYCESDNNEFVRYIVGKDIDELDISESVYEE